MWFPSPSKKRLDILEVSPRTCGVGEVAPQGATMSGTQDLHPGQDLSGLKPQFAITLGSSQTWLSQTWLLAILTRKRSFARFCVLLCSLAHLRLHSFVLFWRVSASDRV